MGNLCTHTLVSTTPFHRKHPQTCMNILLYPRCCYYLHFVKRDGLLIIFTWADRNFRFRWAVCQIEVLRKCLSVSVLRHALRTLPETLDETYDRVLMDIPREYHREAYSALQILSVAGNCVSVADVAEAVAVDRTSCTFDPENRLADPFDIVEVLSTLVTYSSSQIALRHEKPLHGHFPGLNVRLRYDLHITRSRNIFNLIASGVKSRQSSTFPLMRRKSAPRKPA